MTDIPDSEAAGVVEALEEAIATAGGVSALASGINVSASSPGMWKLRRKVPAEYAPAIERLTRQRNAEDPSKKVVTCERLAPRVAWEVLRMQIAEPATAAGG